MSGTVHNLDEAFALVPEPWQPHRLTGVNDYDVKIARLHGEFIWHTGTSNSARTMCSSSRRASSTARGPTRRRWSSCSSRKAP